MKTTSHALRTIALGTIGALGFLFSAQAAPPTADETRLLAALQRSHPGTRFTNVSRTPIPGLYEVWMGPNVAFVSNRNLRYLVFGRVFDTKNMADLTAPKLAKAERIRSESEERDADAPGLSLDQLPLGDAIKTVHGTGGGASRMVIVFSDPACPYCKRLEPELGKIENVTIYTFLVPFQGYALPASIWCAADRQKAWRDAILDVDMVTVAGTATTVPPTPSASPASTSLPAASCAHPLERNLALAKALRVQGTPTIIYANGRRTTGYANAAEIESRMAAVSKSEPIPGVLRSQVNGADQKETTQ